MATEKKKILLIEHDARALREAEVRLSQHFAIVGVSQADRGLALLRTDRELNAVVASSAKGFDALAVLNSVRHEFPKIMRFLLTGFDDLTQVVEGLHSGTVQRVLAKPLTALDLNGAARSLEHLTSQDSSAIAGY